ncbi:MAG: hypothetical protein N2255_00605, partial [Kiritimatiellae bacterium]|nr:hypothetical protein [Kiritimatiellia bacterium]
MPGAMQTTYGRTDMLSPVVPSLALWIMAVVGFLAWIVIHFRRSPNRAGARLRVLLPSLALGMLSLWCLLQAGGRVVELASPWPLWCFALGGAIGLEAIVFLYVIERQSVSRACGAAIFLSRLLLLVLVLVMLLEPLAIANTRRTLDRQVIILLDDSVSMHLQDQNLSAAERLAIARLFGFDKSEGRPRFDNLLADLRRWQSAIAAELSVLTALRELGSDTAGKSVENRRREVERVLEEVREGMRRHEPLVRQAEVDMDRLDEQPRKAFQDLRALFVMGFDPGTGQRGEGLPQTPEKDVQTVLANLANRLRDTKERIQRALEAVPLVADGLDGLFVRSLGRDDLVRLNELALRTRAQIARRVIFGRAGQAKESLAEKLRRTYKVRLVRFGVNQVEENLDEWLQRDRDGNAAGGGVSTNGALLSEGTDIAGALEYVLDHVPSDELAGVILLTDGRHNADSGVESAAARLAAARVPVKALVLGGREPLVDAAILNLRAADSLYLGDRVVVRADLKFDGLRDRNVKVRLYHGEQVVQEESVKVPEQRYRTSVRLSHTPAGRGIFPYRLEVEAQDGEIHKENNSWRFEVAVSDDRTNVLLVDDRPRWEFRYLRNLFYGRDKSVHLQFVLVHPDSIEGAPTGTVVRASASRKFGEAEANALPDSVEEWRKFDAIILGDLPPDVLTEDTLRIIQECVAERGAFLVIIAGPRHMPHAYSSVILRELLPVVWEEQPEPVFTGPEKFYSFRLTPEGRDHVIMQLSASVSETVDIWNGLPNLFWRHPVLDTKDGATILAYAEPVGERVAALEAIARGYSAGDLSRLLEQQMRFRRKNSLVVFQQYGKGKV